jgi:hypothetical protein
VSSKPGAGHSDPNPYEFAELCPPLLWVQLKIRDAFENEGDAAEKSWDVCRDIAALQGSFRTYTGDG